MSDLLRTTPNLASHPLLKNILALVQQKQHSHHNTTTGDHNNKDSKDNKDNNNKDMSKDNQGEHSINKSYSKRGKHKDREENHSISHFEHSFHNNNNDDNNVDSTGLVCEQCKHPILFCGYEIEISCDNKNIIRDMTQVFNDLNLDIHSAVVKTSDDHTIYGGGGGGGGSVTGGHTGVLSTRSLGGVDHGFR